MSGSEAVERLRVFLLETPFKRNVRREIPVSVNGMTKLLTLLR